MVILMPIRVECHIVPHLKALTPGIDHTSGHERDGAFTLQKKQFKKYSFCFINRSKDDCI